MEILNLFNEFEAENLEKKEPKISLLKSKNFVIYGAGSDFNSFRRNVLDPYNLIPFVIIDKKFCKNHFFMTGPCHPDDFVLEDTDTDMVAVIALGNYHARCEAYDYLEKAGFKTIISSHEIYEHFNISKDPELDKPDYYTSRRDVIKSSYQCLEDPLSKEVYVQFLKSFITREYQPIPFDGEQIQYFPTDVPMSKSMKYWVNGGAYNGDTIDSLCENFPDKAKEVKMIWAFEPDMKNFLELAESSVDSPKIKCMPFGLTNSTEMKKFNSGNGKGSGLSTTGDSVMFVALDELKFNMKPTFINMDIEGSELSAVMGALKMIKKHKPDLAICVYHHPGHIWSIIDLLNSMGVGYKFFLRNYTGFVVETVLYATVIKDQAVDIQNEVSEWEEDLVPIICEMEDKECEVPVVVTSMEDEVKCE